MGRGLPIIDTVLDEVDANSVHPWIEDTTMTPDVSLASEMEPPSTTKRPNRHGMRIVGGTPAMKYFYKSIVAIRIIGRTQCGGTLIRPDWVLTAAHCILPNEDPSNFAIVAGEYVLSLRENVEQLIKVKKVFKHKKYNKKTDINDIALFQLEQPVMLNKIVQVAILPTPDFVPEERLTIVGWGALQNNANTGSDILQEVNLPSLSNEKCKEKYPNFIIEQTHICTLQRGGGKDACQGDSGGPLYSVFDNGTQILAGVVSWGIQCAMPNNPGVYTRVTSYLDWINQILSANPSPYSQNPAPVRPPPPHYPPPVRPPSFFPPAPIRPPPIQWKPTLNNIFGGLFGG